MSKKKQIERAQHRQRQGKPKASPTASAPQVRPSGPTQAERLEQARRSRRRRSRLVRFGTVGVVVAVAAAGLGWKVRSDQAERRAIAAMTAGTCRFDRRTDPGRVNQHADNATFEVEPPSGGVHDPSPASPAVYGEGSAPPDARIVHALEHGDIALWYRAGADPATVEAMEELAAAREDDVLVLARPGLDAEVAAVAWRRRLLCEVSEPASLRRFIERYADEGPENQPEESAAGGGSAAAGASAGGASAKASRTT